jgi:hypothetical protein
MEDGCRFAGIYIYIYIDYRKSTVFQRLKVISAVLTLATETKLVFTSFFTCAVETKCQCHRN